MTPTEATGPLEIRDLFDGYDQAIGETDDYSCALVVRVCQMCGAVVADEGTHLRFHAAQPIPGGFELGSREPYDYVTSRAGRWSR